MALSRAGLTAVVLLGVGCAHQPGAAPDELAVADEAAAVEEPAVPDEPVGADDPDATDEAEALAALAVPNGLSDTDRLLHLIGVALRTADEAQRRTLETSQRLRYQAEPTYGNLLALTVVRAYTTVEPDILREIRTDLQVLSSSRDGLTDSQRFLALAVLTMVDGRLRLGDRIANLQHQIDSLTEIEDSLRKNDNNVDDTAEAQ